MRENQAGFRKGRSCLDQIFSLQQIIEKCLDQQLPCLINFIDFKAVFDSVHRPSLWEILRLYGIPTKYISIIKNSYKNTSCAVKAEGNISSWFNIVTGVRQGDIWSPLLFSLVIDFVMKIAVVSCRLLQLELVGPRGQWQSLQQLDAGLLLGGVT